MPCISAAVESRDIAWGGVWPTQHAQSVLSDVSQQFSRTVWFAASTCSCSGRVWFRCGCAAYRRFSLASSTSVVLFSSSLLLSFSLSIRFSCLAHSTTVKQGNDPAWVYDGS